MLTLSCDTPTVQLVTAKEVVVLTEKESGESELVPRPPGPTAATSAV
jgi:hypothetical protein